MRPLLRPVLLVASALGLAGVVTLGATGLLGGTSVATLSTAAVAGRAAPGIDPAAARRRHRPWSPPCRPGCGPPRRTTASWSTLALAYVEQARITADPTYYAKADQALARAAALAPDDSVLLTARGHPGRGPARVRPVAGARRRQALAVNPYSAAGRGDPVRRPHRARAVRRGAPGARPRADDLDPGPSTFARLSYQAELRGDLTGATRLMRAARSGPPAPAPRRTPSRPSTSASWRGRPASPALAAHHYRNALEAEPTYMPALAGQARLAVARGDLASRRARLPESRAAAPPHRVRRGARRAVRGDRAARRSRSSSTPSPPRRRGCSRRTAWPPTSRPRCSRPITGRPPMR